MTKITLFTISEDTNEKITNIFLANPLREANLAHKHERANQKIWKHVYTGACRFKKYIMWLSINFKQLGIAKF